MSQDFSITGTITLADGTVSSFSIDSGLGWQQWGAERERLGRTSELLECMTEGLRALPDDDEEDED